MDAPRRFVPLPSWRALGRVRVSRSRCQADDRVAALHQARLRPCLCRYDLADRRQLDGAQQIEKPLEALSIEVVHFCDPLRFLFGFEFLSRLAIEELE